ncbi:hypothetical protein [Rheinheimera soli]|uniref:hypothetical protein n=1 Tax=Rheinheimera soli TaxID=443616 RepID=UPI001E2A917B|nr:hypothetical protein [Rheinheimera soli]
MNNKHSTQQISLRMPLADHQRLVLDAEKRGTTVADIARQRIQLAEQQIELKDMLSSVVNILTSHMFTITSVVAGLNPDEKENARALIEAQLKRKIK